MNIWETLERHKEDFTPKELEICELVRRDPYAFASSTAMEIASRYNVAQSAISRFCQKAGFNSFADFRMSMILSTSTNPTRLDDASSKTPHDFVYYMCDMIRQTAVALPVDLLCPLARRIVGASRVYTSGYGASYTAAHTLAFKLTLSSVPASLIAPSMELETLHIIKSSDIVFLFSMANPTHRDFLSLVEDLSPEKRPYIVLVDGISRHPLRRKVSQVITLPNWMTLQYPFMIDNSISQFAFSNLLCTQVNALLEDDTK